MKQRQNECFLRNSEKSHQVWYSRKNDPTLYHLMKENNTHTIATTVPTNSRFPRVFCRRP